MSSIEILAAKFQEWRNYTKDPTDLGLEDYELERYTDMWAIVAASLKADTGTQEHFYRRSEGGS